MKASEGSTQTEADGPPVYRTKPLPKESLRGQFLLPETLIGATRKALVDTALEGIRDGGHEGLVYWAGRQAEDATAFLSVVIPVSDHGPQYVMVSGPEVSRSSRAARNHNIGILAQVHSHPGWDGRHSDGDDDLILMPYEGMLSVVAPHFGRHVRGVADLAIHQYQEGRWVLCTSESVERGFVTVPTTISLQAP